MGKRKLNKRSNRRKSYRLNIKKNSRKKKKTRKKYKRTCRKKLMGGLKPTEFALKTASEQVDLGILINFIKEQAGKGIIYPPIIFYSNLIHQPHEKFKYQTINYQVFVFKVDHLEEVIIMLCVIMN